MAKVDIEITVVDEAGEKAQLATSTDSTGALAVLQVLLTALKK